MVGSDDENVANMAIRLMSLCPDVTDESIELMEKVRCGGFVEMMMMAMMNLIIMAV
jgi:hypothetical protein